MVYMSASLPCMSWNVPIGAPNCLRSCTYGSDHVEARAHDAERPAGQHDALVVEPAHEHAWRRRRPRRARSRPAPRSPRTRVRRCPNRACRACRASARSRNPCMPFSTMNAVTPLVPDAGIDRRVDDEHVRAGAVRDPHLVAVQHVAVAARPRVQAHAHDVGAGAGLAHRERAEVLAADQPRQVALLLLRRAPAAQLVDAEVRVRAVGKPDAARGAADLFHRDDVREVAEPGAAVVRLRP